MLHGFIHTQTRVNQVALLFYTQAPIADLEAICDWQAQRQATRFARRQA